jgi:thioredoxin-dependent peroxiredoxin
MDIGCLILQQEDAMLHSSLTLAAAAVVLLGVGACARAARPELEPGDPAPNFVLEGSDGKTYRLSDYLGRQAIVVAWFPKAFTSG